MWLRGVGLENYDNVLKMFESRRKGKNSDWMDVNKYVLYFGIVMREINNVLIRF